MMPGRTVRPPASMTLAPRGTRASPAAVTRRPSMTTVAFAIGSRPSPSMRRPPTIANASCVLTGSSSTSAPSRSSGLPPPDRVHFRVGWRHKALFDDIGCVRLDRLVYRNREFGAHHALADEICLHCLMIVSAQEDFSLDRVEFLAFKGLYHRVR